MVTLGMEPRDAVDGVSEGPSERKGRTAVQEICDEDRDC